MNGNRPSRCSRFWAGRCAGAGVAPAGAHVVSASTVGMEIFRGRSGFTDIGGGWTAIGGVERSWTPVAWLPSRCVVLPRGLAAHRDGLAGAGLILALCGSIAVAVFSVKAVRAPSSRPNADSAGTPERSGSQCSSGSAGSHRSR